MVCEGLFNLFGTSSAEIIAQAKQEARLLRKNNISFE